MKRILVVLLVLTIFINFSSCERDDICVDGDTPLLIIGFFDFDDTTSFKPVSSLRVRALANNTILGDIPNNPVFGFIDRSNVADSVFIPLQLDNTSTTFEFILNSASTDEMVEEMGTIDTLGFSYNIGEQFISRGCGFVANYNDLDTLRMLGNQDWIRRIEVSDPNVTNNPTAIHVKVFH